MPWTDPGVKPGIMTIEPEPSTQFLIARAVFSPVNRRNIVKEQIMMAAAILLFSCVPFVALIGTC
jgi:hypothetical protein